MLLLVVTYAQSNLRLPVQGCVADATINGLHYVETSDGKFTVLRGTNRNESCHRRINAIWPDRCGKELAAAILLVFFFNWSAERIARSFDNSGAACTSSRSSSSSSSSSSNSSSSSSSAMLTDEDETMVGSSSTTLATLLHQRCPMKVSSVRLLEPLLKYEVSSAPFIRGTESGNALGGASLGARDANKAAQEYGQMLHGSQRGKSALTSKSWTGGKGTKRSQEEAGTEEGTVSGMYYQ